MGELNTLDKLLIHTIIQKMLADFRLFCSINIGQIGFFISIADALSYVTTKFADAEKVNKLQEYEFF